MLANPTSVKVADALVDDKPNFGSVDLDDDSDVLVKDIDCSDFNGVDDVEINTADDSVGTYDNDNAA